MEGHNLGLWSTGFLRHPHAVFFQPHCSHISFTVEDTGGWCSFLQINSISSPLWNSIERNPTFSQPPNLEFTHWSTETITHPLFLPSYKCEDSNLTLKMKSILQNILMAQNKRDKTTWFLFLNISLFRSSSVVRVGNETWAWPIWIQISVWAWAHGCFTQDSFPRRLWVSVQQSVGSVVATCLLDDGYQAHTW